MDINKVDSNAAQDADTDCRVPVTILTGFLGAGKTTLLNRFLSETHGLRIAVIVNEIGEIGIDGELIIRTDEEVYELTNGCICCNVRGDLIRSLSRLARRRGGFDRVLVETTGLAMVGPIAQTFLADDEIASQFVLDGVIALVDAHNIKKVLYGEEVELREVAFDQIVFADRIVLNKIDTLDDSNLVTTMDDIRSVNPFAEMKTAQQANVDLNWLMNVDRSRLQERGDEQIPIHEDHHEHNLNGIMTIAFEEDAPLDSLAINYWLTTVITELGPRIYRAKGVLNIADDPRRQIFHSVFQLFDGWPDRYWREAELRRSKIVVIGKDLDRESLLAGFIKCKA